jgi:hypothetical protein
LMHQLPRCINHLVRTTRRSTPLPILATLVVFS